MIIKSFSNYLKQNKTKELSTILLYKWLEYHLNKEIENNIDIVIKKEITISKDKNGNLKFSGKSKTGKDLLQSLYNFTLTYDQHKFTKWIHKIKASDFGNI